MEKRLHLSKKFALKKCRKRACTQEDRISQLPDDILVHILSFLSIKEAADTRVLSRRWLPLWNYIPRFDFDATKPLYEVFLNLKVRKVHMKKYVRWVNHTLQKCKVQRLDQFRVCFDLNRFAQHDIDKWLEFAFARQVQRLELDLLKGEVLEFFLHNCPFLEEMVVHGSRTLVNLEITGPSLKLKHLKIWFCQCLKSLIIHDTNLVTLVVSSGSKLLLSNAPTLVEIEIGGAFRPILDDILARISCVLSQLEVLKITTTEGLEYLGHYKFPELTKLKKFVVCVHAWEDMSLLGCTHVMGAAPLLKEFELKGS